MAEGDKNYKRIIAMKNLALSFLLVALPVFFYAQSGFNKVFYDSITGIFANVISSDCTPFVALKAHSNQYGRYNFSAIGINENGEQVWEKEKCATDSINNAFVHYKVLKKGSKGYYCFAKTDRSNGGTGKFSLLVMDSCFNTIYFKDTLGYYAYIGEMLEYANGDYYFCGQVYDTVGNSCPVANYVKTDSLGNVLWNKQICNPNIYTSNQCISFSSDGYILLGGEYNYSDRTGKWMLTKMDTSGNVIWQRFYGRNGYFPNLGVSKLLELPNSCYLMSGAYPAVSIDNGYEFYYDGCLRKISADGEQLWEKRLRTYSIHLNSGNTYLENDIVSIIISDGYIYILGTENKEYLQWYNSYLMKMDFDGNILWKRIYYGENAYNCEQHLKSFARTPDGGFIMGGYGYYANIGYQPSQQPWIVKTDSLGVDGLTTASLPELNVDIDFPDTLYCGDTISCMLRLSGKSAPYKLSFSTGQTIDSIFYPPVWMPKEIGLGEVSIGASYITYGHFTETEATIVGGEWEQCIHKPIQVVVPNRIGVQQITIEVRDFYGESKTITKEINVVGDCVSGIENIAEQSVSVYPNPASGSITIAGENIAGIEICNLLGEVVYEMLQCNGNNVISTDGMGAGSYFVRVTMNDGKVVTKKIVVIKG